MLQPQPLMAPGQGKGDPAQIAWLGEARSLADQIWAHARTGSGGAPLWLLPAPPDDQAREASALRPHLYDGVTGVALFLAAMEHATGSSDLRERILHALAPLRCQLKRLAAQPEEARDLPFKLGGLIGLGAYVYSFLWIGRWLEEPELLAEAAEIAVLITPDRIAADDSLEIAQGCAGALLSLLALDREAPRANAGLTPLERAIACGEHLLLRRVSAGGQPRAWAAAGRPPLCGFAHGAAGISHALARLFERTGEASFREAAAEGIAFERLHYDPERGNWRFLGSSGPAFVTSWCHGAPGIALGRAATLHLFDDRRLWAETRAALETTATAADAGGDFLCCGEMGKADILLYAHETLGGERLLEAATGIATRVVSRSRQNRGRYRWFASGDRFALSFFRGAAGVGYAFLRLARPGLRLPCVLLLEGTGL
jgi:lantibiotic modifying enzyme